MHFINEKLKRTQKRKMIKVINCEKNSVELLINISRYMIGRNTNVYLTDMVEIKCLSCKIKKGVDYSG